VSAGAKDADTIRLLEDELEAGRAQWLAVKAELGGSLAFESERNVQLQALLSSVRQELHKAREAGEASKQTLAVSEGTAGDCKKRCDALRASLRDAGRELSGVAQRLARAVSSGAKDADSIRQLEDELEAGQTKCHALNPSGTCSCRRRCPACVRSFTKRGSR